MLSQKTLFVNTGCVATLLITVTPQSYLSTLPQ